MEREPGWKGVVPDEALMRRVADAGEERVLSELYDRYGGMVYFMLELPWKSLAGRYGPRTLDRTVFLMLDTWMRCCVVRAQNGTLLAPEEVFSMNGTVSGLEYNEAKVIVGGAETEADGGGLCQVTSNLYNAANFAGLDVIERTPHSAQLPYIRPGMDATVWWGGPGEEDDLDMKFQNTTSGYLLLREFVAEDGFVRAEIWGRPMGIEVEMTSKPVRMTKGDSEWVTYQRVEKDGEVVFNGVLHKDTYEPLVEEKGKVIPPSDVPVAPGDP